MPHVKISSWAKHNKTLNVSLKNVVLVYNKSFYQPKRIIYEDIHACTCMLSNLN